MMAKYFFFIQARVMKRRGWNVFERWQIVAHPFWICILITTILLIPSIACADKLKSSTFSSKNIIDKALKYKDLYIRKEFRETQRNIPKPITVKSNDIEHIYVDEDEGKTLNEEDYYYYYVDDIDDELYHLETPKNTVEKPKENVKKLLNVTSDDRANNVKVVIDVGKDDNVRAERDSFFEKSIFTPHDLKHHHHKSPVDPPEVYSTGWVVIPRPHPPPPPGNYVRHSTTPAPPALHLKHQNNHHHIPHHPEVETPIHDHLVPITTVSTITTTLNALPTPTQHLPFHNFPKYHKHKNPYVPKNVYVQDQPYDTVEVVVPN